MIINRIPALAIWIALAASLGTGVPDSMSAPAIQGTASVIDGDTIEIRGQRIRLDVIDAPENSRLCLDPAGKRYRCGQKSAFALADTIGRSVVNCEPKGRDRYKRVIAVCFKGDINLNACMVVHGWAVAFRKYGIDVPGHGYETVRCAGYAANLNSVAASDARAFCSALI